MCWAGTPHNSGVCDVGISVLELLRTLVSILWLNYIGPSVLELPVVIELRNSVYIGIPSTGFSPIKIQLKIVELLLRFGVLIQRLMNSASPEFTIWILKTYNISQLQDTRMLGSILLKSRGASYRVNHNLTIKTSSLNFSECNMQHTIIYSKTCIGTL